MPTIAELTGGGAVIEVPERHDPHVAPLYFKYSTKKPPKAVTDDDVEQIFQRETWDKHLPQSGFITDLVYASRGFETTTKFAVWSAVWAISTLLKRDAYMKWFPKNIYPNIYVLFVAPPRICAKSTAVDFCEDAFREVPAILESVDERVAYRKHLNLHHSKITPEAINDLLEPKESNVQGELIERGSEVAFIVSELTTFLGKQKYNVGLVDALTKLYDSRDVDDEMTRGQGKKIFKDIYVTLFGATTPSSFRDSIPQEAFGGGFMSRVIIAKEEAPTRYYPIPMQIPGAPDVGELAQRLSWIALNAFGEYQFSREAYDKYTKWYRRFKDSLVDNPQGDSLARLDTNLIKLCIIMRAQRYAVGNIITLQDFEDALNLLEYTYDGLADFMREVSSNPWEQQQIKVKRVLQRFKRGSQADLWKQFIGEGIPETVIEAHMLQLRNAGLIEIDMTSSPTQYIYKGD